MATTVDHRPNTGRLTVTVECDHEYTPDDLALDAICRHAIDTFARVHVTIETYAAAADDDDGCAGD